MAEKRKLTVRVDERWIEAAKNYAREHDTSLSRLISEFLKAIASSHEGSDAGPILRRLTAILPSDVARDEHREHLANKHGS